MAVIQGFCKSLQLKCGIIQPGKNIQIKWHLLVRWVDQLFPCCDSLLILYCTIRE